MTAAAAGAELADVAAFLYREARLLDERRFGDWLDLFTDTGWYWVPISPDQDNPRDTISLIYDDRRLLETRIRRLRNPRVHAQVPPSRTSRIVGNVAIEAERPAEADLLAVSNFQLVEYRRDRQRLFAGSARHGLVRDRGGFRIQWKRVDLVNSEGTLDGISVLF